MNALKQLQLHQNFKIQDWELQFPLQLCMRLLLLLGHRLQMKVAPGFRLCQKMPKRGIHLHMTLVAGKYVCRKQKCGGESIFLLYMMLRLIA